MYALDICDYLRHAWPKIQACIWCKPMPNPSQQWSFCLRVFQSAFQRMCVCAQSFFPHRLHSCLTVLLCSFFLHTSLLEASFALTCNCQGVRGCTGSGNNPLNPTVPSAALSMSLSIIYTQAQLRPQSLFESVWLVLLSKRTWVNGFL